MFFLIFVMTVAVSAFLTYRISRPGSWLAVADLPNARSLHAQPIPRGGGIAIFSAVYLAGVLALLVGLPAGVEVFWLAGGSLMIGVVSYVDDCREVPARYRLAIHVVAAGLLIYGGVCPFDPYSPGFLWQPGSIAAAVATLLYIVWVINLYNFMDGMDGFAGGMTLVGFAFLAYFGWLQEAWPFFLLSMSIAAASLGFLLFNFPPARVFMGDVGSAPLGYMAAGLSLWGVRDGIFSFWVPVLLFSPFMVDATVTLLQRLIRGENLWQAGAIKKPSSRSMSSWLPPVLQQSISVVLTMGLRWRPGWLHGCWFMFFWH